MTRAKEHPFTLDGYAHAHEVGRLTCVICGGRYIDHPASREGQSEPTLSDQPQPVSQQPVGPDHG